VASVGEANLAVEVEEAHAGFDVKSATENGLGNL
jgi:hypothetical protein